ncbi:hypothetical protein ABIA03_005306 [Bradyrhizobium yuanmingense]|uniref:Uncharacterized protein n=1 Tax=Bradyrhizobium yuanmingense TaxID=108015 RepID=A0ABV4GAW7_9BRAD
MELAPSLNDTRRASEVRGPVKVTKPIASILRGRSKTDPPSPDGDDECQLPPSAERRQVVDEYAENLRKIIRRLLGRLN